MISQAQTLSNKIPRQTREVAAPFQKHKRIIGSSIDRSIVPDNFPHVHNFDYVFKPLENLKNIKFCDYCGPTPESNWVIPGVLLVGAYPASQDDDETFDLITSILKLQITKFVCLQEEYRTQGVTEAMWRYGHALRPYYDDVKKLVSEKNNIEALNGYNVVDIDHLSFVHFPIKDCSITDDGRVLELAISLVKAISEGEIMYLHCWGGHGRTGTVVCIMLYLMYGLDPVESMARCQRVHDLRQCPVVVGSPQTQTQRDQVTRIIRALMHQSTMNNLQVQQQPQRQPQKNHINDNTQQAHDMKQQHINSPTPPSPLKIDPISLNMKTLPPNSPLNPTQTMMLSSPSPFPIMRQTTDTLVNEILIFPEDVPNETNNLSVTSSINNFNNSSINDNKVKKIDSLSSNIDNAHVDPSESSIFPNINTQSETSTLQSSMIIEQNNSNNNFIPLSEPFESDVLDKSIGKIKNSIQEVNDGTQLSTEIDISQEVNNHIEQCTMTTESNHAEISTLNDTVEDTEMTISNNDKDDEIRYEENVNSSNLSPIPPSNESPSISSAGRAFRVRSNSLSKPS